MKTQKKSTRPLYVRVLCWVLIALMLSGAAYYTIWGLQLFFASLAG